MAKIKQTEQVKARIKVEINEAEQVKNNSLELAKVEKEEKSEVYYLESLLDPKMKDYVEREAKFEELLMMYDCAIKEVKTKLEILNSDLSSRFNRNPIENIKHRVKSPVSIAKKLKKLGVPVCFESIPGNLNDVAGIRVICSFIDDIYVVAEMLTRQDDIKVIKVKDYIKNPKPNGYRSLHLVVEVPVFFVDATRNMRVEVQLRTMAMDFWASLEHQLKYKKDIKNQEEIEAELKKCADTIAMTDESMVNIRNRINLQDADSNGENSDKI